MLKGILVALGIGVLGAALAGGWWWSNAQRAAEASMLRASGMLEATETRLSSPAGGRLMSRPAREGARVRAGEVLATLDTEQLDLQIQMASDAGVRRRLEEQRAHQVVRAPMDGWVMRTVFQPGEHVPPGAPVVVIADLRELTLKVYLPEDKFGQVALGQAAAVTVDSYPGEEFPGEVTFIASEAEFTPRNVQTREDRVKSVYAIKLRVPNEDLALKPGMFADAVFVPEGSLAR